MRKLVLPKYFGRPSIGLALFGCTNRPFYQICVFPDRALGRRSESSILEQVGTFDPLPNVRNEKLVALNIGRIKYWVGERNAHISVPVLELLGLSGLFPIHPKTFIRARDNRRLAFEAAAALKAKEQEAKEKEEQQKAKEFLERQQLKGEQGEGKGETSPEESKEGVRNSERRLGSSGTEQPEKVGSEGVEEEPKESRAKPAGTSGPESEAHTKASTREATSTPQEKSSTSSEGPDRVKSEGKGRHREGEVDEKRKH